jgi:hypothetical protein
MPVVCIQASVPFIPRSAKSIRLTAVRAVPIATGDDGDAGQVGVLPEPLPHRRVLDLVHRRGPAEAAQPQGVGEHADRAHRHRGGREHRVEQQLVEGVEGAGGDRDEQDVVGEGEGQALPHDADGAAGQGDRGDDAAQVTADEGDVGGGDGDVGAGADGDPEVGWASAAASLTPSPDIATT